jgi:hypothetical protein
MSPDKAIRGDGTEGPRPRCLSCLLPGDNVHGGSVRAVAAILEGAPSALWVSVPPHPRRTADLPERF